MLNDWTGFDVERAVAHLVRCQSFDGGIGLGIDLEGHGVQSVFITHRFIE